MRPQPSHRGVREALVIFKHPEAGRGEQLSAAGRGLRRLNRAHSVLWARVCLFPLICGRSKITTRAWLSEQKKIAGYAFRARTGRVTFPGALGAVVFERPVVIPHNRMPGHRAMTPLPGAAIGTGTYEAPRDGAFGRVAWTTVVFSYTRRALRARLIDELETPRLAVKLAGADVAPRGRLRFL